MQNHTPARRDEVRMPEGIEPVAASRKPAAADGKTQALIALFMTGCLPAETCDWIANMVGPTLRA